MARAPAFAGLSNAAIIQQASIQSRRLRRPRHTFQVAQRPWGIQPFCIAPVLPGESLVNLTLQSRCVTDPIKNPLCGWWNEYYFFYVKHRDLAVASEATQMMLEPTYNISTGLATPASDSYHHRQATRINWTLRATEAVVTEYFRDEGDTASNYTMGGVYAAKVGVENYLDSLHTDAEHVSFDTSLTVGGDDSFTMSELHQAMDTYQLLQSQGLVKMDYEDFLASYGVNIPKEEQRKPELIRYVREWSYPSNTIDPANGTPRSAVSWTIQERADKRRFFKEPGFILGLTVTRPKIYMSNLRNAMVDFMDRAIDWLPASMLNDPTVSMKKFTAADGPITGASGDYWIDLRDLFIRGDSFWNYAAASMDGSRNAVALPEADLTRGYATTAMADSLFVAPASNMVRMDGIVSLAIQSHVTDATATTPDR